MRPFIRIHLCSFFFLFRKEKKKSQDFEAMEPWCGLNIAYDLSFPKTSSRFCLSEKAPDSVIFHRIAFSHKSITSCLGK